MVKRGIGHVGVRRGRVFTIRRWLHCQPFRALPAALVDLRYRRAPEQYVASDMACRYCGTKRWRYHRVSHAVNRLFEKVHDGTCAHVLLLLCKARDFISNILLGLITMHSSHAQSSPPRAMAYTRSCACPLHLQNIVSIIIIFRSTHYVVVLAPFQTNRLHLVH